MQNNNSAQHSNHVHLVQMLSSLMVQVNALQALVRDEEAAPALATTVQPATMLETLREGLATLEQMARDILHEIRSFDEDVPLPELIGITLIEALTRAVEDTAELLGLSSRLAFSGEERTLPSNTEGLLYRIAREALYQVQQHTATRRLRLALTYGHDEVQMSIEDDGTPVSVKDETPIPPPFNSASPETADVILSDLRHRVERLGGSLEVIATPEDGFHVRARVPYGHALHSDVIETPGLGDRLANETASLAKEVPAGIGVQEERVRVLVVEAQAVTRAGLRRLLESYPDLQVVGEAADGVQAVSETLELGPQVVLMDMQLPNGQSLEALRQIKQLNLNTQVLLLSALDREDYLYETLRAGAGGYVLKDIAPDELAQAVRTVARGQVLVQPQLARRLLSQFGREARGSHPYETLTAREQEVLRLLARGLRNKEMAARLHVSERTINFHLANIYAKLNVSGRTEALSKALEQGLITA